MIDILTIVGSLDYKREMHEIAAERFERAGKLRKAATSRLYAAALAATAERRMAEAVDRGEA